MTSIILNYAVRSIVIVLGVIMLSGLIVPANADPTLVRAMGGVFVLFGIYRIIVYYSNLKRYRKENTDE